MTPTAKAWTLIIPTLTLFWSSVASLDPARIIAAMFISVGLFGVAFVVGAR